MYAEERQSAIVEEVASAGRCAVVDLASRFGVSAETVRRDLLMLERGGHLRRVHGGAVGSGTPLVTERPVPVRTEERAAQKQAIADRAVDLLPAAGSVLVDAGTTTARFAATVPATARLTIITHALPVAATLGEHAGCELRLLPGRVRSTTQAAVGADTVEALSRLRVDLALVATNALGLEQGLTTPDHDEAATKRALVRAARKVVVLADSTKLEQESTVRFADLADVDTLVTDAGISDALVERLEQAGVEVLVA
ncbi:DeoR/GlpR family DNA-binding transcription regulator [Nocardioidaceae bacterium]|nr:DeoR/GlpR family DNA-binding transcription regulator [Nocardioidaceae bacterium]